MRPELTRRWLEHTLPLMPVVVAVSDDDGEELAQEYGLTYVRTENRPLGAKHNSAMALARAMDPDAVMILPSDDFINPAYLTAVINSEADYIFPGSCGFYDTATRRSCMMRWDRGDTLLYGAGRVVSRAVLGAVPRLWTPTRLKGLDQDSHCTIRAAGFEAVPINVTDGSVCLTDIKTGTNLWGYDIVSHRASSVDDQVVMSHVSWAI
jgi:hypothetical protein